MLDEQVTKNVNNKNFLFDCLCFVALGCILLFQIEKIVLFLLKRQGELATTLSGLADHWEESLTHGSQQESIMEQREGYREVGRDLLRILFFVEMNAIGLRKILKKIDKRFGYKFTNYYVKTRANHPYSQLRQVFKHVVQY